VSAPRPRAAGQPSASCSLLATETPNQRLQRTLLRLRLRRAAEARR
jgi:hypothetical protein